jgi:hypothetical protein
MAVPKEILHSFSVNQTDVESNGDLLHYFRCKGKDYWKQGEEAGQVRILGFETSGKINGFNF